MSPSLYTGRYSLVILNYQTFHFSCQTYEGGIGGSPWSEAHGGYTYCAVATLSILNALDKIDARNLLVGY